ncbi:hypothetical protein Tco_1163814 [Tanacetum coccineum]
MKFNPPHSKQETSNNSTRSLTLKEKDDAPFRPARIPKAAVFRRTAKTPSDDMFLGIREYQKEEIDIDYRRKCEDKIYELKDKFNGLSIEIRKIIQEAEELRESEASVQNFTQSRSHIDPMMLRFNWDFMRFHPLPIRYTLPFRKT